MMSMAMVMGVTASVHAANPFSDVPAGHWAYDAVARLTAAGVVDGYGTRFGGDKLMTRYEMAQIVAKAMAKGGDCDKLAAEFSEELDALGVRVAKVENKVDNFKVTAQIRFSNKSTSHEYMKLADGSTASKYNANMVRMRTRLFMSGQINDDWKFLGCIEQNRFLQDSNVSSAGDLQDGTGDDSVSFNVAHLAGRIGGVHVEAGRQTVVNSDIIDTRGTGLKLAYGNTKFKVEGWVMRDLLSWWARGGQTWKDDDRIYMLSVSGKPSKLGYNARYWKSDDTMGKQVYSLELNYPVAKNLQASAIYYRGSVDMLDNEDRNGYRVHLAYKGAKAAKPGSWGLYANYSNRPFSTYFDPTAFSGYAEFPSNAGAQFPSGNLKYDGFGDGYKGWTVGGSYALAKNVVFDCVYYGFQSRKGEKRSADTIWTDVIFTF